MTEPRIPSNYARALQRWFARTPVAKAEMLEGTDFQQADLDVGADMPLSALMKFVSNLTRLRGRAWAIDAAPLWSAPMHGALEVGARSAATANESLIVLARFGRVRAPFIDLDLRSTAQFRRLRILRAFAISDADWPPLAEVVALSAAALLAPIFEEAFDEIAIEFPWGEPAHGERLRALLRCRVHFDMPEFALEAPHQVCRRASPFEEPHLHARSREDLEAALCRLEGRASIVDDVERLIARALPRRLGEAEAARRLGLSRRTLVRRLAERDVTFRSLADATLREKARAMLAQVGLSRDEMAEALGYAEPTSFSRACRRWFG